MIATGKRIQKRIQPNQGAVTTTDYFGEFQYENGVLQFFAHPEGYVKPHDSGYLYVYQYKDHLGNIRLSYADVNNNGIIEPNSEILEENNYYPFGLKHQGYNEVVNANRSLAAEKYKFGDKEWNDELGLNLYDFHARNYDAAIGRWLNVDPLAERGKHYSPYNFNFNSPINFFDPDGLWPYPIIIRSFHPSASFGGGYWGLPPTWNGKGYSGDNRGFSLDRNASSRIHHRVVADPQAGTVTYSGRGRNGTYSDPSHHPTQGVATDVPDGYIGKVRSGNNSISFETGYNGKNPLASGPTPEIDVDAKIKLTQNGDILNINAQVAGDNFPNTEAFIEDPSGQKLFIGVDVRASGQDKVPTDLFGPATEHIMDVNLNVKTDTNTGNFISVQQGENWINIQDYNKQFLNKNPNP
ncbi:RHS repeat domain-containing protein [Capnocytophaga sp. ARDL2]|uniref:RHS repeat domain-containing protein n=1 Tax=Capnocytophaga sp. ARDL2 TaxID=3238809 RepID=UPI003557C4C3